MTEKKQIELENDLVSIYKESIQASTPLEIAPADKARIVIGFGRGRLTCTGQEGSLAPFMFENRQAYFLSEKVPHTLTMQEAKSMEVMIIEMKKGKEKRTWPPMPLD